MKSGYKWGVATALVFALYGCGIEAGQEAKIGTEDIVSAESVSAQEISEAIGQHTGLTLGTEEVLTKGAELSLMKKELASKVKEYRGKNDLQKEPYLKENTSYAIEFTNRLKEMELELPHNSESEEIYKAYYSLLYSMELVAAHFESMTTSTNHELYADIVFESLKKADANQQYMLEKMQFISDKLEELDSENEI